MEDQEGESLDGSSIVRLLEVQEKAFADMNALEASVFVALAFRTDGQINPEDHGSPTKTNISKTKNQRNKYINY